jgi:Ni/Co efflux regulator RcnB
MSATLKLSALLLALAVVALPASAAGRDNDRGHRGHDRNGQYERHRGHDRRGAYNDGYRDGRRHDRRNDRRHDRRIVVRHAPRVVYRDRYVPRPVVVHRGPPRWARGHRYYGPGYGRTSVVNDYNNYGLRRPPGGYYCRRSDAGDYLLVAIATGIIADLILSH